MGHRIVSLFSERLAAINPAENDRRWLYVPYDQLNDRFGPLSRQPPRETGIVLVESSEKASRRPYHRQKLALVLANQRHFALEQAERGVAVRYVATHRSYRAALRPLAAELGPLRAMRAAERELDRDIAPLVRDGVIEQIPHEGWLTSRDQFRRGAGDEAPWRMDAFYRLVRRESGFLMKGGKPEGGKFSFDAENRKSWRGEPAAPRPPRFEPDELTREVGDLIARRFERHPGQVDLEAIPATRRDAEGLWSWALEKCLPSFGPYEDAMSARSRSLFHTRVSPLLNIHRLLPATLVSDVAASQASLPSREGFVRQVLGWREFVRHVHLETDGFRTLPDRSTECGERPGNGGWSRWTGESWLRGEEHPSFAGGAEPSTLEADWPLPLAYWGRPSGLACLDRVVTEVWETAYTHHIPRLMVLANIGTLLGVRPRELADWFWIAFADAYDWVVEPNVLGMGTYAVGGLFTTKPYVSGANYINRMSDYCQECRFDPKSSCPLTRLYWSFLARNRERLRASARMGLALRSLDRRSPEDRRRDAEVFESVRRTLEAGQELTPDGR
jgi:deoxyribodipyrimidine photolyase-related protein